MLLYTSCFFGTVVLHAYWRSHALLHFLCLCQTMLSMLNYGDPSNPYARRMDMSFALSFFGQGTYLLVLERNWLLGFALAVAVLYVAERRSESEETKTLLHAALHVVACLGLHLYLCQG